MQWQLFLTAGGQDVLKIKNSVAKRLRMNKYYGTEKTRSDFFENSRHKFRNMSDLFQNISDIFFAQKETLVFKQLQRRVFYRKMNKSGNVNARLCTQGMPGMSALFIYAASACGAGFYVEKRLVSGDF